MIKETCCFIGHQYQSLPFGDNENHPDCIRLKADLEKEIIKLIKRHHVWRFISGMDLGMDTWCAEIVLKLKEQYTDIRLECALPCETQAKYWRPERRRRYEKIIASADKSTLVANRYHQRCNAECTQLHG